MMEDRSLGDKHPIAAFRLTTGLPEMLFKWGWFGRLGPRVEQFGTEWTKH
jgi:hypothetical protein